MGARPVGLLTCLIIASLAATPPEAGAEGPTAEDVRALQKLVQQQQRALDALQAEVENLKARDTLPSVSAYGSEEAVESLHSLENRTGYLESLVGNTDLGGWLDFRYGDGNRGHPAFDAHHLYLYLDTRIDEKWQSFAELEFEHAPRVGGNNEEGEIKLERLFLKYSHNEALNVRAGKFSTQFGYWTPIHWAILVDTIQKPIHEDNKYVPRKQVGIEISGTLWNGELGETPARLEYKSWISNGPEIFDTNHPEDGKFGYGFDLRSTFSERHMFGMSGYFQDNPSRGGRDEMSVILYSDLQLLENVTLRGEYFYQNRTRGNQSIHAGYAKARWDFTDRTYLNYRVGMGEDEKLGAGDWHLENVLTLGYSPHPNVRLKTEMAHNRFQSARNFLSWGAYAGFFF